ncbi:MAG: M20/M25/M40 family metallo-hydrolase [Acidobacteria bacterium]|nr:M20/M25/M40 family metallo-hydrolase [Acidobacteriota bacterium]
MVHRKNTLLVVVCLALIGWVVLVSVFSQEPVSQAGGGAASSSTTSLIDFFPQISKPTLSGIKPKNPKKGVVTSEATSSFVNEVNINRYVGYIKELADFKSRYSTSPGCDAAANYLMKHFSSLGFKTELQPFPIGPRRASNVIATLPGTADKEAKGAFLVFGAHYDSISRDSDPLVTAPGAEDNASGTAALMELATLFHDHPPRTTVVLVAFAGEEEGLIGSTAYVDSLRTSGSDKRMQAALIMDMIGYTKDADLDILFETSSKFESIAALPTSLAAEFTRLRTETSLRPFGSDHVPFLNEDLPAFLVIENDWDAYPAYHRSSDVPANISNDMAGESMKLVAAWAYKMANERMLIPVISTISYKNSALVVKGENFQRDAQIEIDDQPLGRIKVAQPDAAGSATYKQLKSKDSRLTSLLPEGKVVTITVLNPQTGTRSTPFSFERK